MKSENTLTFIQIKSEIGALFVRKMFNFRTINIQIEARNLYQYSLINIQ